MAKRDPERTRKIRVAVRYLIDHGSLHKGNQTRLAEHFQVSRQRVHQIVVEERRRSVIASAANHPAVRSLEGASAFGQQPTGAGA
jgi:hypothetical protein